MSPLLYTALLFSQFLSHFGQTVLAKTDFICFGSVQQILPRFVEVAQFEIHSFVWIRENYVPPEPKTIITVMGNDLGFQEKEIYLMCLKKLQSENTFRVIGKISKTADEFFEAKYENMKQVVSLEQLTTRSEKMLALKSFFLKNLSVSQVWLRNNAYGELISLAQQEPNIFDQADVQQILKAYFHAQNSTDLTFKENLKTFLKFLKSQKGTLDITLSLAKLKETESGRKEDFATLSLEQKEAWFQKRFQNLRQVILNPQEESDRQKAWKELYTYPIRYLEPFLLELLSEESPEIVSKATDWLAKRGTSRCIDPLVQWLPKADGKPRAYALKALARLQHPETQTVLRTLVDPQDPECDSYLSAIALYLPNPEIRSFLLDFRDKMAIQGKGDAWISKIDYFLSKGFQESQQRNEEQQMILEQQLLHQWSLDLETSTQPKKNE